MGSDRASRIAATTVIAAGVGLIFVHYYGGSPGDPEGWFAAAGFGAPFIGAGCLALLGATKQQQPLMLAAAISLGPMSLLSVILIPLLIPAAVLLIRAVRAELATSDVVLSILLASVLVAAMVVLVFHQDPAQWSTDSGGGSSSNIVTTGEAGLSIGAATAVNLVAIGRHTRSRSTRPTKRNQR